MTIRRKAQLKGINSNLGLIIKDYTIFIKYDDAGITAEFEAFLQAKMHGTYLQDNLIQNICSRITPSGPADWTLDRNYQKIALTASISREWAEKIVEKLCYWNILFELQALAKQPKPVITVLTKSIPKINTDPSAFRWATSYNFIDYRHAGGVERSVGYRPARGRPG